MSTPKKIAVGVFIAFGVLCVAATAVAGAFLVHDGVVTVRVHEKHSGGANFAVPLPGSAVRLAFFVADSAIEPGERLRLRSELSDVQPFLAAVARELADCPNVTLVNVQEHDSHVTIEKRNGTFSIHVDDPGAEVRISMPASLMEFAIESLGDLSS